MYLKKMTVYLLAAVCLILYGFSAIRTDRQNDTNVSIDISRPVEISWPCEISIVGDTGEEGLRIAPKIGRGWLGEAGGQALYRFYIPQTGKYYIWVYSLWFDVCSNAVFAKIDDMEKAVVGNDPIYNTWHWVRGFEINLSKGTHTLILSNHSDNISIQRFLFTSTDSVTPDTCGPIFSDIFYEGFDGCDNGNFSKWKIVSGSWSIQNPTQNLEQIENDLAGQSESDSLIIYQGSEWSNYSMSIDIKTDKTDDPDASAGVCFAVRDSETYHELGIRPEKDRETAEMTVFQIKGGKKINLGSSNIPWNGQTWHKIAIKPKGNSVTILIDNTSASHVPVSEQLSGGIGLKLNGRITACFDDIHVMHVNENKP